MWKETRLFGNDTGLLKERQAYFRYDIHYIEAITNYVSYELSRFATIP